MVLFIGKISSSPIPLLPMYFLIVDWKEEEI
jgi:hypothetical protein